MDPNNPFARANATYWLQHELRQYPAVQLDVDCIRANAARIIPAAGRDSTGTPAHDAAVQLAERLHRSLLKPPGGHLGCVSRPAEFAAELVSALAKAAAGLE
jgi:acetyltransferase/esterase